MKTSHLAVAAVVVLLPLSVACSSSKDIAEGDPTTTQTTTQATTPTSPPPTDPTTSSTPPTTPTTPPASTTMPPPHSRGQLEGTGYSVVIPSGWMDITRSLAGSNPDLDIAMGESDPSGFRTNFNVVNSTTIAGTIEDDGAAIRRQAASELKSLTHALVRPLPDRVIDGEAAIGQTSSFVSSGTAVTFLQYFVIHDGQAYPITMTSATENTSSAAALLDTILNTWTWTA